MRPVVARPDGELEVLGGFRPAARSGGTLVKLDAAATDPAARGHDAHAPARTPGAGARLQGPAGRRRGGPAPRRRGAPGRPPAHAAARVAPAAGQPAPSSLWLRGGGRAPRRADGRGAEHRRLRVVGAARATRRGDLRRRDRECARRRCPATASSTTSPICATELRCYTAQNTFLRRYEGALPGLAGVQRRLPRLHLAADRRPGAGAPAADAFRADRRRARRDGRRSTSAAPTPAIVSFGQGCEGEPLTRDDVLAERRRADPRASIPRRPSTSTPTAAARRSSSGSSTPGCNSVRISAISFTDAVFRAYYRPVGYSHRRRRSSAGG